MIIVKCVKVIFFFLVLFLGENLECCALICVVFNWMFKSQSPVPQKVAALGNQTSEGVIQFKWGLYGRDPTQLCAERENLRKRHQEGQPLHTQRPRHSTWFVASSVNGMRWGICVAAGLQIPPEECGLFMIHCPCTTPAGHGAISMRTSPC